MKRKLRDVIDIHIRLRRQQLFLLIGISLLIILAVGGFVIYSYYRQHYFDSSGNGSEANEIHQRKIPPDVRAQIKKEPSVSETLKVPILMYHYVEYVQDKNDKTRRSLDTSPGTLEEQIKTLISAGYTFMTNTELADVLDGKKTLPAKPILLTFDDGYRDFYTDAFPILKKYNVKATAYLISGFLNRPNHLLGSEVDEIIKSGLVEIGAHTIHHVWLKGGSVKTVSSEISQSKSMLEQEFHIPVVSFAYPYGAFDSQAIQLVKDAGFRLAVSTIPGDTQSQTNRYFLFRLRSGGRTGQALLNFLAQLNFNPY